MKQRAVIFPFCAEILPAVKLFEKLQSEYSLQYLVSPKGLGYTGHDAAYACNHPPIGMRVLDKIPFGEKDWEVLILFEPIMQKGDFSWEEIIRRAICSEKEVVFLDTKGKNMPEEIIHIWQENIEKIMIKRYTDPQKADIEEKVHEPEIPVILIGGLLREADCFEVFLQLLETLKQEGWNVAAFSDHPMGVLFGLHSLEHILHNNEYTEAEKISQINIYVNSTVKYTGANILLLEAPDALMKYNECIPNGYGIWTYMLCQAVTPDYLVCCVPFELAEGFFVEEIGKDFLDRLGSNISAVHISNVLLDVASTLQNKQIEILHANMEFVHRRLRQVQEKIEVVRMFNVVVEGTDVLYQSLIGE